MDTDWIGCPRCSRQISTTSFECAHCGEAIALVRGVHYTRQVETIKELKRQARHDDAVDLLLECIAAVEAEALRRNWSVAPGYYLHLAIVYRKQHRYADEVALLERAQVMMKRPYEEGRLAKARQLLSKIRV